MLKEPEQLANNDLSRREFNTLMFLTAVGSLATTSFASPENSIPIPRQPLRFYVDKSVEKLQNMPQSLDGEIKHKSFILPVSNWEHNVHLLAQLAVLNLDPSHLEETRATFRGLLHYKDKNSWKYADTINPFIPKSFYHDDMEWTASAYKKGAELEPDETLRTFYNNEAKNIFTGIIDTYQNQGKVGGVAWMESSAIYENNHINTVSTAPLIALYYKFLQTEGPEFQAKYSESIQSMEAWIENQMYDEETGLYNDRLEGETRIDDKWTYNQGTMILVECLKSQHLSKNKQQDQADIHTLNAESLIQSSITFFDQSRLKSEPLQFVQIYFSDLLEYVKIISGKETMNIYNYILDYVESRLIYPDNNPVSSFDIYQQPSITAIWATVLSEIPKEVYEKRFPPAENN